MYNMWYDWNYEVKDNNTSYLSSFFLPLQCTQKRTEVHKFNDIWENKITLPHSFYKSFHLIDAFLVWQLHGILALNEKWLDYILQSLEEQGRLFFMNFLSSSRKGFG
jgi:hypothetical protein